MVYGFARRSGGKAEIASEPGHGTTVRIYLPRGAASEPVTAAAQPTQRHAPKGRKRVLVVEDEPAVRHLTTTMLRHLGYEVVDAEDGRSAMQVLEGAGVDLMLTDADLPGGTNGIDLAREARRLHPALAVLLMSGYPDKALELVRDSGDQYELIAKPFESADLGGMLRAILDRAAGRRVSGGRARSTAMLESGARLSRRPGTSITKP